MPRLREPMPARSDAIWTHAGFRARSRGWNMIRVLPKLRTGLPGWRAGATTLNGWISRRTGAVGAAVCSRALVLLVVAVLGGCGGGGASPELQALKSDPLGRYEPPGGRLIDSNERDGGSTLGKPVYPEYWRMYALPPGDPERQLEQAAAAAAAAGWLMSDPERSPVGGAIVSFGDKRLSTGRASAGITLFPKGPPSGATSQPTLLLRLRNFG